MPVAPPVARRPAARPRRPGEGAALSAPLARLFVYGTLQPGEARWELLQQYVVGEGRPAVVGGALYDTGLGYPAASFTPSAGSISGLVYTLRDVARALTHLDEIEGAVRGLYRRVVVVTDDGGDAWAYECGDPKLLRRHLPAGDWLTRSNQNGE